MSLSTHVLDAVRGVPAAGLSVELFEMDGRPAGAGSTDADGRIPELATHLEPGRYRLRFDTGAYFTSVGAATFYPEVVVAFEVTDAQAHYHVPLLLSPYAYSTYRGS